MAALGELVTALGEYSRKSRSQIWLSSGATPSVVSAFFADRKKRTSDARSPICRAAGLVLLVGIL